MKPILSTIILYATSICNAHCKFCDVGQNKKRGIKAMADSKTYYLTLKTLSKILEDEYIQQQKPMFYISMTEPLLNPLIYEIIYLIKQIGSKATITTNGFLLKKRAKDLTQLDGIQVSIDGPKDIHNSIRGNRFYERAIEGIRELNRICDVPVYINYTVSNINSDCLVQFINEIKKEKLKIALFKFQFMDFVSQEMADEQNKTPIKTTTSTVNNEINPLKVNTYNLGEQLDKIRSEMKNYKIIPDIKNPYEYFNKESPLKNYDKCFMPYGQIAIKTNGDVYWHLRCFPYKLGNVLEENIREIFFGEKAEYFRKEFEKFNYCMPACTRCCGVMG